MKNQTPPTTNKKRFRKTHRRSFLTEINFDPNYTLENSNITQPQPTCHFTSLTICPPKSQNSDKNIDQLADNLEKTNLDGEGEQQQGQTMSGYAESFAKQLAQYSGEKEQVTKQNSGNSSSLDKYGSKYSEVHSGNQKSDDNPSGVPAVESEYLRVLLVPLFTQVSCKLAKK